MGQWHVADVNLGLFYPRPFHSTWWYLYGFFKMYVVIVGVVMNGTGLHTILPIPVERQQITQISEMRT
jgi:hypothetical protein